MFKLPNLVVIIALKGKLIVGEWKLQLEADNKTL